MSIQEKFEKYKSGFSLDTNIFLAILLVLVALASFLLGRMSVDQSNLAESVQQASVLSEEPTEKEVLSEVPSSKPNAMEASLGGYVASKNGTKYHLPWCSGAQQMKEENKIWFATKEEAEAAGYTPAANCKGI